MRNSIDAENKKQTFEIQKLKPKEKQWVNLISHYNDVWNEIFYVYDDSIVIYREVDRYSTKVKTEHIFMYEIRTIIKELPKNARVIYSSKGAFSERRKNLKQHYD